MINIGISSIELVVIGTISPPRTTWGINAIGVSAIAASLLATKVLTNCRRAMAPQGRVFVVDAIASGDGRADIARMLDLEMAVLTGGRERRKPEIRRLFAGAGLTIESFRALSPTSCLITGLAP